MKTIVQTRAARFFMLAVAIALISTVAQGQDRKVVNLAPARGLPFNDGIVARSSTLYIAGEEGTDDSAKLVAGWNWPRDHRRTLENIVRKCSRPPASI